MSVVRVADLETATFQGATVRTIADGDMLVLRSSLPQWTVFAPHVHAVCAATDVEPLAIFPAGTRSSEPDAPRRTGPSAYTPGLAP